MATGTIPAGVRQIGEGGTGATNEADARKNLGVPQLIKFANLSGWSEADLLTAMNDNNGSIPLGVSLLQLGSATNPQAAVVLCIKSSATIGRGRVTSSYSAMDGKTLTLGSAGWTSS